MERVFCAILYVYITFSIAGEAHMNQETQSIETLHSKKKQILQSISELGDFRQGSLSARYRKCGKPYCHCAKEGSKGHGPLWMVTRRAIDGKTVSKSVPPESVDTTFEQIETFHQFQSLMREYTEVNIKICDAQLDAEKTAFRETKKGG